MLGDNQAIAGWWFVTATIIIIVITIAESKCVNIKLATILVAIS